jgi:hypothetical protein
VKKLSNGELDADLKPTNKVSAIDLSEGYIICDDGGELRVIKVPAQTVGFNALSNGITYKLYIVPKSSSYEPGTIALVNGSDMVTLSGGDFQEKVYPYENIVVDTSGSGNDGLYKVYRVISSTVVQLASVFQGTSESGLKWKISGDLGKEIPSEKDLLYYYDSYEAVISPSEVTGIKIAEFVLTAGNISSFTDKRADNLFSQKNISQSVADEIIDGTLKAITLIEEKAQAATVNKRTKDFITRGVRSGGAITLSNDKKNLQIESLVAYNLIGERIEILKPISLTLQNYVTTGDIVEGDNYLFIDYASPNTYRLIWTNSPTPTGNEVLLASLRYNSDVVPPFQSVTIIKEPNSFTVNDIVLEGKIPTTKKAGQLFYDSTQGILFYGNKNGTSKNIDIVEIINYPRLSKIVDESIGKIAKSERLRFSLWIGDDKNSWFFFNGIQAQTFVGYNFKVPQFKVGFMALVTPLDSDTIKYDYLNDKYAPRSSEYSNILSFTDIKNDTVDTFPANSTIGVFYNGAATNRVVQLVINGVVVKATNMNDETNSAPKSKLYHAEIEIQFTDSIITVPGVVPTVQD